MNTPRTEIATLAGGCFWCLEAVFERVRGVERVVSGFAGGGSAPTSYRDVCNGSTDHAEVIQVTFDPAQVGYRELLELFFVFHDPTTLDRQGPDTGRQYRSAIYTHSSEQERVAREVIQTFTNEQVFGTPIVTEITPFDAFVAAEPHHQGYYNRNAEQPYCRAMIAPKLAKLRQHFAARLREEPAGR
ncbi:MAG: peptide-methionine (S)-S-oxide reductase MsrA [Candidatus Eisenbacteria bacterium]